MGGDRRRRRIDLRAAEDLAVEGERTAHVAERVTAELGGVEEERQAHASLGRRRGAEEGGDVEVMTLGPGRDLAELLAGLAVAGGQAEEIAIGPEGAEVVAADRQSVAEVAVERPLFIGVGELER